MSYGYGKLFASMYDGTLYGKWQALVTFQQFIILCDQNGIVDMTPHALAARTSIPLDVIMQGVKELEEPDPYSRTPGDEGRRIERLDDHRPWGWRIVNYRKYRDMLSKEQKREADRERIAAKRAASDNAPDSATDGDKTPVVAKSNGLSPHVANVAHTSASASASASADKNSEAHITRANPVQPFDVIKAAYPKFSGRQDWINAQHFACRLIDRGESWEGLLAGVERYAHYCANGGVSGSRYVLTPGHFFADADEPWSQRWDPPAAAKTIKKTRFDEIMEARNGRSETE